MVVMVVVVVGVLLWKKIKCGIVTARYDKNRYIDLMKFGVQQWMARREWGYFGKMDDVGNGKQEEEGRRSVKTGSNREGEVRAEFILGRGGGGGGGGGGGSGGGGGGGGWWETRLHDVCFHGDGLSVSHTQGDGALVCVRACVCVSLDLCNGIFLSINNQPLVCWHSGHFIDTVA